MTEAPDDSFRLAGTVVDGRYAVERAVARGGGGVVYRAAHVELASPVALKVLVVPDHLRGDEATLVDRFRREARTLAALQHPAVVRVLDVGRLEAGSETCVWMVMEWLDGHTLAGHLAAREGAPSSPREALALLAPVLDAVACAHERGVAHRDLKPANIMAVPARHGGVVLRVLDFGIAKEMRPDESPGTGLTETRGDHAGFSLPYAAPEQIGRLHTGPWTDVHALGLLLTTVLTGRAPYPGDDSFALYGAVMSPERPTPARFGVDVGPWEPVLARALALRPGDRFADAGALQAALAATADEAQRAWDRSSGSADTAPPAAPPVAVAGTPRRRPSRVWWAAALAVPVLVLAAWSRVRPTRHPVASPSESARATSALLVAPAVVDASLPPVVAPTPATPAVAPRSPPARPSPRPRAAVPAVVPPRPAADPDRIVME